MPIRVQLSRRKGFLLADAAGNGLPTVKVDRTTRWGNQFKADATPFSNGDWQVFLCTDGRWAGPPVGFAATRRGAILLSVAKHREWLTGENGALMRAQLRAQLEGKNLACWCPLGSPCHADVLLEIANSGEAT